MSASTYIKRLEESETYKAGTIEDIDVYSYRSRFFGLFRSLPKVPCANNDRHIVVIDIQGNHPSVFEILSQPDQTVEPTTRDADNLVFVFVSVRPEQLSIESPPEGYRLGDGQHIDVDIELVFKITNVEDFWKAAKDPISALKSEVKNEIKKYFLGLDSTTLIARPLDSHQQLEQQIADLRITGIRIGKVTEELEVEIRNAPLLGVQIERVYAHITLSKQLNSLIDRHLNRIFGPDGVLDRRHVDAQMDSDSTFRPYCLKNVVMELDTQLLENFYAMPYSEAMKQVHESLTRKRQAFRERTNEEITQLKKYLQDAENLDLDEMYIADLKDKIGEKMLQVAELTGENSNVTNFVFIDRHLNVKPNERWGSGALSQLSPGIDAKG